jgi:hypothetical protein
MYENINNLTFPVPIPMAGKLSFSVDDIPFADYLFFVRSN